MTAFGPSRRLTAVAGALLMATGVVIGAFGAHWLANLLTPERLSTLRTAVDYQFLNGLGLLLVAALDRDQRPLSLPAALLLAGALLFCGALYALVATDVGLFGAVAPVGGALMIAGWLTLALLVSRDPAGVRS